MKEYPTPDRDWVFLGTTHWIADVFHEGFSG